ncbi:MAG: cytochrome c-type biogenesis protein CcmH [Magnetococcus sp. DMHC-6]
MNLWTFRTLFFFLALSLSMTNGLAVERQEDPTEAKVRHIAQGLRCAVCQNQSVYESNSDLAKDMLEVIRDQVKAGVEESKIRDYFYRRYGDYIYMEPIKSGSNWVLWAGPFFGLLLGGWALTRRIRSWQSTTEAMKPSVDGLNSTETAAMQERIRKELERVDV